MARYLKIDIAVAATTDDHEREFMLKLADDPRLGQLIETILRELGQEFTTAVQVTKETGRR